MPPWVTWVLPGRSFRRVQRVFADQLRIEPRDRLPQRPGKQMISWSRIQVRQVPAPTAPRAANTLASIHRFTITVEEIAFRVRMSGADGRAGTGVTASVRRDGSAGPLRGRFQAAGGAEGSVGVARADERIRPRPAAP